VLGLGETQVMPTTAPVTCCFRTKGRAAARPRSASVANPRGRTSTTPQWDSTQSRCWLSMDSARTKSGSSRTLGDRIETNAATAGYCCRLGRLLVERLRQSAWLNCGSGCNHLICIDHERTRTTRRPRARSCPRTRRIGPATDLPALPRGRTHRASAAGGCRPPLFCAVPLYRWSLTEECGQ